MDVCHDAIPCDLIEIVHAYGVEMDDFRIIVDEEGALYDDAVVNPIVSWIYGYKRHGQCIYGNAVIVKEVITQEGPDLEMLTKDEADLVSDWLKANFVGKFKVA